MTTISERESPPAYKKSLILSLDFDGCYTEDPVGWEAFIYMMRNRGHQIWVITMRYPHEGAPVEKALKDKVDRIVYTSRRAKTAYANDKAMLIDIWIDDSPLWLMVNAGDYRGDK